MTRAAATKRNGFKPDSKLRSAADFDRVRQDGRRVGDAFFSLQYLANSLGRPRLGMAVSLRSAGNAVVRNRVRRVVRESFRLRQHELPACDLFVTARGAAREASNAVIFASLERLWRKVPQR